MTDKIYLLIGKIVFYTCIVTALYLGLKFVNNKIVTIPIIGKYFTNQQIDDTLKRQLGI